uniref:Uncharacterized protein n=1 Tax=Anguilla anguilla TaxID=7936 RepID=A0A0E9VAL8_ANGAN
MLLMTAAHTVVVIYTLGFKQLFLLVLNSI